MRNPFLIGEKVYLRPIEEADAARCYPWFSDPEVRRLIGRSAFPNTEKDSLEYIRGADGQRRQMFAIVVRDTGEHIGNCELMSIDAVSRRAEVGIAIGQSSSQGKGFGRDAVRLLCEHAFRALNLHRVHLRVHATNERALRCYRAVGFREEGRLREHVFADGRYVDEVRMGLLRSEHEAGDGAAARGGQTPPDVR